MSSTSGPPDAPAGPIQLNGWKEIAAYLGRSVRTVQRWEKDFGLPVRRFGMSRPESVFAIPSEIDNWLMTSQGVRARSGVDATLDGLGDTEARSPTEARQRDREREPLFRSAEIARLALVAFVTLTITVALWVAWTFWVPGPKHGTTVSVVPAQPADWQVDFDSLVVSDSKGNVLWRRAFPGELLPPAPDGSLSPQRLVVGGIADFEGDGTREVWFIAKPRTAAAESALYLFEQDGRLRWTFRPSQKVRFGADTFGPSWIVDRAYVTPDPAGGPGRAIWVSMIDTALFPSSIQRIDIRTGASLSAYWTNGSIVTATLDMSSPPKLLVGACYNETKAGSLSVLDALNPNGSAPATLDKYRCMDCPPGDPLAFLVFPKPARFAGIEATGPVEIITPRADGSVGVRVLHAFAGPGDTAVAVFTLDSSLAPVSVDTADGYLSAYNTLAARGEAPANAPKTIDPEREFLPILWWNSAAQRYMEVTTRR